MIRTRVHSSNIFAIGYDASIARLEVQFHNGHLYQFYGVPMAIYNGLLRAPSKGKFFDIYIKKGPYVYRQIR